MTQYAKIVDNTLQQPQASEFRGIPNWETNTVAIRNRGYLPVVGEPEEREGYTATPSAWHIVQQSETKIEPRREDPVTREPFIEDVMEEDPETHEMKKVGEQQVTREVPVEFDTSYIQLDDWTYELIPEPPEPPQPEGVDEVKQATAAIINRIAKVVIDYNAVEDIKALDNFNIESLLALANAKGVKPEDMASLKEDLVLLKTDLEGKMDANWYRIWNNWLKGEIANAMQHFGEPEQEPAEPTSEEPQDEGGESQQ